MYKKILILLLSMSINTLKAQHTNAKATVNVGFGHAPDCRGYSGVCTFQKATKNNANALISYNTDNIIVS